MAGQILSIGISRATTAKGLIVGYLKGDTFSREDLRNIRAPKTYYILDRRDNVVAELHARDDTVAKALARAKFHMKGLKLVQERVATRRVRMSSR